MMQSRLDVEAQPAIVELNCLQFCVTRGLGIRLDAKLA